jgi:hypothetical protein
MSLSLQALELLCAYPDPKAASVNMTSAAARVTSCFFITLSFIFDWIFVFFLSPSVCFRHCVPVPPRELNSEIPARLEEVINKALEKDRNLRYQNAADMRTDCNRRAGESCPDVSGGD